MEINVHDTVKIKISPEEIITFFNLLKDKVQKEINKKNDPKLQSLNNDIARYYEELFNELMAFNDGIKNNEGKVLLGMDNTGDISSEDLGKMLNDPSNPFMFGLDQYMKNGDFRKVLQDGMLKVKAYGSVLKKCIDDYGEKKHSKELKRERALLDEFVKDYLIEFKKAYVDFMITLYVPNLSKRDRRYLLYELVDRQDFEKYIPPIKKFLDKLDKRVI